jgi:ApbE superfamily uncharacterized protein (UPF0280 family)
MNEKYTERFYRNRFKNDKLTYFTVKVKETDLSIGATGNLHEQALASILKYRAIVETYIEKHPEFLTSFSPIKSAPNASFLIRKMCDAAFAANVGPMAAIAGAIAEAVGYDLLKYSDQVIVENGGDVFIHCKEDIKVGIFSGDSPFKDKLALKLKAEDMPLGVCSSSGKIGPSISFGKSDVVTIVSKSTYLADAALRP